MSFRAEIQVPASDPAAIEIWTFALDEPAAASRLLALLSPDERRRADQLLRLPDAERFRVAHGRLREILGHHLGAAPQAITFGEGAQGKPHIATPETTLRFNLTHSEALAAVAVSQGIDVGIDIERIKPLEGTGLEGALSPREQGALAALAGSERRDAFYRCWTRKEALLKAYGRGLEVPLESFDVPVGCEPDVIVPFTAGTMEAAHAWRIVSFTPAPGYAGAVAFAAEPFGRSAALSWRTWPEDPSTATVP